MAPTRAPTRAPSLVPFRPARVHALIGGSPQTYTGAASIRKDGWLELSTRTWRTPAGEVVHGVPFVHFPPERVMAVEWLAGETGSGAEAESPEPLFVHFEPARVLAVVCGRFDQLAGTAAQLHPAWLELRPNAPWRLGPKAEPDPEVTAVSLPRHVVHLVEWTLE